jgi:hypothetical protein
MIAGAEAPAWPASRLSPNAANANGLVSQPPGSAGNCPRPATMKLLVCPLARAAQRCVKRLCAWLGFDGKVPKLSLKLDVGLWIVTVPFKPNGEKALTLLVESFKNTGVVIVISPPTPLNASAITWLCCKTTTFGSIVISPPLPAPPKTDIDRAIHETDTIDGMNINIPSAGLLGFRLNRAVPHDIQLLSRVDRDIARVRNTGAAGCDRGAVRNGYMICRLHRDRAASGGCFDAGGLGRQRAAVLECDRVGLDGNVPSRADAKCVREDAAVDAVDEDGLSRALRAFDSHIPGIASRGQFRGFWRSGVQTAARELASVEQVHGCRLDSDCTGVA